jgi:hypothetical protein
LKPRPGRLATTDLVALPALLSQASPVTLAALRQQVFRHLHRPWGRCAVALLLMALLSAGVPQEIVHAHASGDQSHHHYDGHDHHDAHVEDHHSAASHVPASGDDPDQTGDRDGGALLHCHAGATAPLILVTASEQLLFTAVVLHSPPSFAGDPPASTTHRPPYRPPIA